MDKKSNTKLYIVLGLIFLVLLGGGLGIYFLSRNKDPDSDDKDKDNKDTCKGNFTGEDCTECINDNFIDNTCTTCKGNFTGADCTECINDNFADNTCTTCKGNFKAPKCIECINDNFADKTCTTCKDNFKGISCTTENKKCTKNLLESLKKGCSSCQYKEKPKECLRLYTNLPGWGTECKLTCKDLGYNF